MNPGKLNRRLDIQARVASKDATGSIVSTWADSAKVWAELVTNRGREAAIADADRNQNAVQFRIRHRAISPTDHRILYQSRFYNITGVTEEGIKNTLLLDAVATQGID